jgi:hypothetical protein
MENLPKNVINKIMFYLSHPTADIIKDEFIFDFMALRLNEQRTFKGSPYQCGREDISTYDGRFTPRKFLIVNKRRRHVEDIEDEELHEYVIAYFHGWRWYNIKRKNLNIWIEWSIKENTVMQPTTSDEHEESESVSD